MVIVTVGQTATVLAFVPLHFLGKDVSSIKQPLKPKGLSAIMMIWVVIMVFAIS